MISTETLLKSRQNSLILFEVSIEGEVVNRCVESITTYREINKISGAKIILSDGSEKKSDFKLSSDSKFSPGSKIQVRVGYRHADNLIFDGIIFRHSIRNRNFSTRDLSGSSLVLECRHPLINTSLNRISKVYEKVTDGELIEQLLKGKGDLKVDTTKPKHPELVQFEQTDWTFAVDRATHNGLVVCLEHEETTVMKPDLTQSPTISLQYGKTIIDLDAEVDPGTQVGQVSYDSWDSENQDEDKAIDGVKSAGQEFVDQTQQKVKRIFHTGDMDKVHRQAIVDGYKMRRNLAKKRGRVQCNGLTGVKLGNIIELKGTGTTFDGPVFVSGLRHTISAGKWQTDIQFGVAVEEEEDYKNARGQKKDLNGLYIGVVLNYKADENGYERIPVKVPVLGKDTQLWARMAKPDAGKDRGLVFWPEENDEVILGFLQNDPNHPIILGSLHSTVLSSPYLGSKDNEIKGFKSKVGLEMTFDDKEETISFLTPKGTQIKLSDKDGGLTISDENKNEIILSKDGIQVTSSKDLIMEAAGEISITGQKVNAKADMEAAIEGGSGLKLSSGAMATIEGTPIKLN